jgi:hypothetical protein
MDAHCPHIIAKYKRARVAAVGEAEANLVRAVEAAALKCDEWKKMIDVKSIAC